MFRFAFALFIASTLFSETNAQGQKFPYKARVTVDEVYVRSGAGEKFYPTRSLMRDAVVTVRRHDPGGWYMVDPPKQSFSWIPAKYVRRTSAKEGEILENNVVVFVGSSFGNEASVWQRMLKAGEKVSIIGEQQIELTAGLASAYKIAPPQREYRWVPGSAVLPVGAAAQATRDKNPYEVPSDIVRQREQQRRTSAPATAQSAKTPQPPASRYAPSVRLTRITKIREEQMQLHELDQQFRSMILSDPSQWKLEAVEQAYLELQGKATHKPIAGQIDLRYPAIRRYRQRKAEIDDLNRLTSQTEQRDAQLVASQFGMSDPVAATNNQLALAPGQTISSEGLPWSPGQTSPTVAANGSMLIPNIDSAFATTPSAVAPPSTTVPNSVAANQKTSPFPEGATTKVYVGAGYVQRGTADEGAGYLLLSNAGKVLAHLKSDGTVDLEKHVGHAVGLKGNRYFDKSLETDRIDVTGLESVKIR